MATPKKAPAKKPPVIDPLKAAQAIVAQHNLAREQACRAELQAVLKKHKCYLSPRLHLERGQSDVGVDVLAHPE